MLLYKSSICILPNVKLKNLISKTEAAPKEHHGWGMSGRGESGGLFLRLKSGHRHWHCFQLSSAEILNGVGPNTLAYIYMYTFSQTHVNASAKFNKTHYAETCAQA